MTYRFNEATWDVWRTQEKPRAIRQVFTSFVMGLLLIESAVYCFSIDMNVCERGIYCTFVIKFRIFDKFMR